MPASFLWFVAITILAVIAVASTKWLCPEDDATNNTQGELQ